MNEPQFNFNRPYKPFGLNVAVPERTLQQAGETLEGIIKAPTAPLFEFLDKNNEIFSGNIMFEINKIEAQNFTIGSAMRLEDEKINGKPPHFDMHF